jgi:hypothetical protein
MSKKSKMLRWIGKGVLALGATAVSMIVLQFAMVA